MASKIKWLAKTLVYSPIYFTLCTTETEYLRVCNQLRIPAGLRGEFVEASKVAMHHSFENSKGEGLPIAIICIKRLPKKQDVLAFSYLVHEAVHLWQQVKERMWEDNPSKEFEACSIDNLAFELMTAYVEGRKTK